MKSKAIIVEAYKWTGNGVHDCIPHFTCPSNTFLSYFVFISIVVCLFWVKLVLYLQTIILNKSTKQGPHSHGSKRTYLLLSNRVLTTLNSGTTVREARNITKCICQKHRHTNVTPKEVIAQRKNHVFSATPRAEFTSLSAILKLFKRFSKRALITPTSVGTYNQESKQCPRWRHHWIHHLQRGFQYKPTCWV